jgi:hypothetical protein
LRGARLVGNNAGGKMMEEGEERGWAFHSQIQTYFKENASSNFIKSAGKRARTFWTIFSGIFL